MNKFVKKSMAGLLAGVMAVSSLAVGSLTAMAALPKGDNVKTLALGTEVKFEHTSGDDAIYLFTPETTGYYDIKFSSEAVAVKDTDSIKGKRSDSAYLYADIYNEDGNKEGYRSFFSSKQETYTEVYTKEVIVDPETKAESTKYTEVTTYSYADGFRTVQLNADYTYAFYADLSEYETDKYTVAKLTVSKAGDFAVTYAGINYEDETFVKDAATKKETTTYAQHPYYEVIFIGNGTNVVVPAQINGVNVESLDGVKSTNDRIVSLTLGSNVKYVGGFEDQYNLTSITLNEGLENIGNRAFYNDLALSGEINIPASVKAIGGYAFYGTNYSSARINGADTELEEKALGFADVLNDATADPYDVKAAEKEGFYIVGTMGSPAAYYAQLNGFVFYDPANCTHMYNVTATKAATYFAKGSTTYVCAVCGAKKTESIAKKKVVLASAKSSAKGAVTVKSKALTAKVTGYKIQYSTSKKFTKKTTKTVTVKTNSKKALSKAVKGLTSGKKYYVRIAVYSGKKTSAYTKAKAVKVK